MRVAVAHDPPAPRPPARAIIAEFRRHRRSALLAASGTLGYAVAAILLPLVVEYAVDRGVIEQSTSAIAWAFAVGALLVILQIASSWFELTNMGRFAEGYLRDLRGSTLDHLYRQDMDFFTHEPSGRLVARLTSDVENLQQFVQGGLALLLRAVLLLSLTVIVMFTQSVRLTLAVLTIVPFLVLASRWYRPRAFDVQLSIRESMASLLTHVNESLVGMRVVQAFAIENDQHEVFQDVSFDTYDAKRRSGTVTAIYYGAIEFLNPAALAIVVGYGAHLVADGSIQPGIVLAFALYLTRLFEPIQQFAELTHLMQAASSSFARIFEFRSRQPTIVDAPGATDFVPRGGHIEIRGVSFRYGADGPDVLPQLDLVIPAHERVAVVGTSGAGKSTLVKLIARFYDPTTGTVLVDGQDIRTVTAQTLRRSVVVVPQEGFLFDGTVADNVGIGRPGATRADIEAACRTLGFGDRLDAIPGGLDAVVSNRGLTLSSGQRQVVGLARAFLADPDVLILDEATSNLDPATDALVEEAMAHLLEHRTALVIAHRVNTALRADRVLVMDRGRIVEDGPPAVLEQAGGAFARWVAATRDAATDAG